MSDPTALIDEALDGVLEAWRAALGGVDRSIDGGDLQADIDAMTDAGLVAVNEALAVVRRRLDGVHARVAAGIATRSAVDRGADGLARKHGHRSPIKLIAAATGGHAGDASRLIRVGQATAGRMTFSGERAPAKRPHIAAAFDIGSISLAAAEAIGTLLDTLALRVTPQVLDEAERTLVQQAKILSLDELTAVLRRAEAVLDPDGVEPKIDQLRSQRALRIHEDSSGMVVFTAKLDPETAAPIKAAIEAIVTQQLRVSRGENSPGDAGCDDGGIAADESGGPAPHRDDVGPAVPETRSVPQLQADALAAICRHALGCAASDLPLASTTVVVRIPLEALVNGGGTATIDGLSQAIDASTARRMAANGNIIPCVLGGDSEILDWGRSKRLFTTAQRLALGERDGGCASCGLPPGMTEAHHILWWSLHHGDTDIRNGILLCTACHHRIHNDGWEIRIDPPGSGDVTGGTVWFIPPAHVDPDRTPRLGGRKRFDYRHRHAWAPAA